MEKTRSLLFYIARAENGLIPWWDDEIELLRSLSGIFNELARAIKSHHNIDVSSKLSSAATEYEFYDWQSNIIEQRTHARKIPRPGIIFAIRKNLDDHMRRVAGARLFLETHPDFVEPGLLYSFLKGKNGQFEPQEYDLFISYSNKDRAIASEIRELFSEKGIRCFMAEKDLETGIVWEEKIRKTLLSTLATILILTPESKSSMWVMCEAGACWVLGRPLIPATLYVEPDELPETISKYQAMKIETFENRKILRDDVISLLNLSS